MLLGIPLVSWLFQAMAIGRICKAVNRLQVAGASQQPRGVPVQLVGVGSMTRRAPASPSPSP
jgi:hypothetical protein